jgi:hypothetical protein
MLSALFNAKGINPIRLALSDQRVGRGIAKALKIDHRVGISGLDANALTHLHIPQRLFGAQNR